ncbi:MAG: fatty acid desaturase [Thermoanaerobaculia bacterium]
MKVAGKKLNVINTLFLTLTPLAAAIAVPWSIAHYGLGLAESLIFLALWLAIAVSVTAGYHRLFAHRAYEARWPVRLFFLVFGAGALENSVLAWAADHRVHHVHVDKEQDPYNVKKGFWWSHIGWIFFDVDKPELDGVRDLSKDPLVVWQDRNYLWIGLGVAFGIPALVGVLTGSLVQCLIFGAILRIVVTHHVTFFINSLCHMIGGRPYSLRHSGRDSTIMAALAFGEGYHNYHHTFAYDYRNGVKAWHFDPAKWTIWALSRFGLTSNLRRAPRAVILRARVEVQFEKAQLRMQKWNAAVRKLHESRVYEAYERMQNAIQELLAQQQPSKEKLAPVVDIRTPHIRSAIRDWKETMRMTRRMARQRAA